MKRTFKYLNENRRKCKLGIDSFSPETTKVVAPNEIVTFELDLEEDDVVFIKTWKTENKILVSKNTAEQWKS